MTRYAPLNGKTLYYLWSSLAKKKKKPKQTNKQGQQQKTQLNLLNPVAGTVEDRGHTMGI